MKSFLEYCLLVEGPPAGPAPPGGPPGPPGGGMPPMGGPPMGGMPPMGGGPGGPPMGGGPAPGGGEGTPGLPVKPKDVWKAIEIALEEIEKKGGQPKSNMVQNMNQSQESQKKHLMGVPGL